MTSLALTFNNVTFNPVSQNDGQIWLTSSQIAEALEYKNTQSITKLFNTNSDEFDETMVKIVKLPTVNHAVTDSVTTLKTKGLSNKMRIFSLRGCHLLAMFARTEKAKEFRKWVLNVLAKEVGQPVLTKVEKTEPKAKTKTDERTPLRQAVTALVGKAKIKHDEAYRMVHQFMGVDSIDQIPLEDLPKAVAYVHSLMLMAGRASHPLDAYALTNLKALVTHNFLMVSFYKTIEQPIKALNPSLWSHTFEHFWSAKSLAIGFNNQFDLGVDERYLLPYRC